MKAYDMVVRTGKFNIIAALFQECIHRGDRYDRGTLFQPGGTDLPTIAEVAPKISS